MNIKPFKLERYYSQYEFTSKYSICNSDCEAMTIKDLLSLENDAAEKFNTHWLGYTDTKGEFGLRTDISGIYSTINEDDLLVCTGAQEPIYLFSHAVLESSDEVVVQSPCYQSFYSVPESIGCRVNHWNVKYTDNKPIFDLNELENLVNEKTKVMYINTPHNPTGYHFTKQEQQAIVEIARKNNTLIFCDEVYRELEHEESYLIPAFADVYENAFSLGVMSKSYGLPGLRIGWLASKNKIVLEEISVLKEYTTICNSAPSEFLAGVGLRNRKLILNKNLKIVHDNLKLYDEFFIKYKELFSWWKPNAGPIAFVKMKFEEDDMIFADKLLKKKQLLILPGGIYDYKGFFRIGFGRKQISVSLEVFEEYVQDNLLF